MPDMILDMYLRAHNQFSEAFVKLREDMEGTRGKVLLFSGALAAVGGASIIESIRKASEFDDEVTKIFNNTTLSSGAIDKMKTAILGLHAASGIDMETLATGLMHVSNFGFKAGDAIKIARVAMQESVATGADFSDTANTLASVLHLFGMKASDAGKAMNVLHEAAAQGNTTMGQFVTGGGRALATASAMHIPLTQVAAAMSALTRNGVDANTAGTMVTQMLMKLAQPAAGTKKELEALSKTSGIDLVHDFSAAGLQSKGLTGVLADLAKATHGNASEIEHLTGGVKGGFAAMVLAGRGAGDYKTILQSLSDAMSGKINPVQEAFNRMQDKLGQKLKEVKAQFDDVVIVVGQQFLGVVDKAAAHVLPVVQRVLSWAEANPKLVAQLAAAVTGIGAFIAIVLTAQKVVSAAGSIVGLLTSPIGLVVAAIAALALAWMNDWGGIREKVHAAWEFMQPILEALWHGVQDAWRNASAAVKTAWDNVISPALSAIGRAWDHFTKEIIPLLGPAMTGVKNIASTAIHDISSVIHTVLTGLEAFWKTVWQGGIKDAVVTTWNAIKQIAKDGIDAVQTVIKLVLHLLAGNWKSAWDDVKHILGIAWDEIKTIVTAAGPVLVDLVKATVNGIKALWEGLKNAFPAILDGIKTLLVNGFNLMKSHAGQITTDAKTLVVNGWNALKTDVGNIAGQIPERVYSALSAVIGKAQQVMADLKNAILNALGGIAQAALAAGQHIVENIAAGIRNAIGAVTGAISSVVGAIADHLPHSPAKTGPLAVLPDFSYIADTMLRALPAINAASAQLAGGAAGGIGGGPGARGGLLAGGGVVNLTINLNGGNFSSAAGQQAAARQVSDAVMQQLRLQGVIRPQLG